MHPPICIKIPRKSISSLRLHPFAIEYPRDLQPPLLHFTSDLSPRLFLTILLCGVQFPISNERVSTKRANLIAPYRGLSLPDQGRLNLILEAERDLGRRRTRKSEERAEENG